MTDRASLYGLAHTCLNGSTTANDKFVSPGRKRRGRHIYAVPTDFLLIRFYCSHREQAPRTSGPSSALLQRMRGLPSCSRVYLNEAGFVVDWTIGGAAHPKVNVIKWPNLIVFFITACFERERATLQVLFIPVAVKLAVAPGRCNCLSRRRRTGWCHTTHIL